LAGRSGEKGYQKGVKIWVHGQTKQGYEWINRVENPFWAFPKSTGLSIEKE